MAGQGAGEGPADMTEELALQQVLRNRGAVDGDEGHRRARALMMNQARQQLLSGAALGFKQNVCAAARRLPRLIQRLVQRPGNFRSTVVRSSLRVWHARGARSAGLSSCVLGNICLSLLHGGLPLWGRRISNLLRRPALAIDRARFILTSQAEVLE